MRVSYSPEYYLPLPRGHPFPMEKFPALHHLLLQRQVITPEHITEPRAALWSDLLRMHTREYLRSLSEGTLSRKAERRMGLPWSDRLVRRSRLAVQGTINASIIALDDGIAGNLAGGTHHAFPAHGEGFCVLNDVAIAIRTLQASHWVAKTLIIDLDVHQGNGNASFFHEDPHTFTFSIHGARNYPFVKPPSSTDVALPDGTSNQLYISRLKAQLPRVLDVSRPELVYYLAGIDVAEGDRFGRINLTNDGIRQRDRYVISQVRKRDIPLVLLLSGGYASSPQRTAELHAICFEEAVRIMNGYQAVY